MRVHAPGLVELTCANADEAHGWASGDCYFGPLPRGVCLSTRDGNFALRAEFSPLRDEFSPLRNEISALRAEKAEIILAMNGRQVAHKIRLWVRCPDDAATLRVARRIAAALADAQ